MKLKKEKPFGQTADRVYALFMFPIFLSMVLIMAIIIGSMIEATVNYVQAK